MSASSSVNNSSSLNVNATLAALAAKSTGPDQPEAPSRRASVTAQAAAFMRGLHDSRSQRIANDPFVPQLLPPRWAGALQAALPAVEALDKARALLGKKPAPNHFIMRTRAIDDALTQALKRGVTQVVVLGAGLDARAFRLDALSKANVFEVDLPASQAEKRARVEGLKPKAKALHFLPVDLNEDVLKDRLRAAGFNSKKPTVFIMEGLSMYLSQAALGSLLAAVDACAGRGSEVIMTYADEANRQAHLVGKVIGTVGEPFLSFATPDSMQKTLAGHHFAALSDTNDGDWATQYDVEVPSSFERLVCARKG